MGVFKQINTDLLVPTVGLALEWVNAESLEIVLSELSKYAAHP